MQQLQGFQISSSGGDDLTSFLTDINGRRLASVQGSVLEGTYQSSQGVLVITTDGNPFEEALHFHLLDSQMGQIDGLTLGQGYHSGILRDLSECGSDCLEFSFFGEERWRLLVRSERSIRFSPQPFSSVRYHKSGIRGHYLELSRLST